MGNPMNPFLVTKQQAKDICKIGQGAACCKYLGASADGLECFKHQPEARAWVDSRNDMTAQSDNCKGLQPIIGTDYY